MKRFLIASLICQSLMDAVSPAQSVADQPLFHIERSKNANVVQYDARVLPDGKLHGKEPVTVYWIRHAEQGQRRELSWVQRTFAYGLDARTADDGESARLELKANIGRDLTVQRDGQSFRAVADIGGEPAWLDRIFVDSEGKGLSTRVNYIELHGRAVDGGGERYEKFVP